MCDPPFSREEERRMMILKSKQESGTPLDPQEKVELETIEARYLLFIEEGKRRLQEGVAAGSNGGTWSPSGSPVSVVSTTTTAMADSLSKAAKAAYFWGSLVATAVPGYLGRKAGVTSDFLHWNIIVDRVILGALPVVTQVGDSGNHLEVFKQQLTERGETLGMVVACLEEEEVSGFGVSVIQFAGEGDWRRFVDPNITYIKLPMEDTTAKVPFEKVAQVVEEMHRCVVQERKVVYVHCKAGKGRSWMVVMCYLTSYGGMAFNDAESLVAEKREQVNPSLSQQCFAREFPIRFAKWRSLQDMGPQSGPAAL